MATHINVDDPAVQEAILRFDKHARLEGTCIEQVCADELLGPHAAANGCEVSREWWFERRREGYTVRKFLPRDQPSAADKAVLNWMAARGVPVNLARFDAQLGGFVEMKAGVPDEGKIHLLPRWPPVYGVDAAHSPDRSSLALRFLAERDLLRPTALARLYINQILDLQFFWDVDAFLVVPPAPEPPPRVIREVPYFKWKPPANGAVAGKVLAAIEVSHKYPDPRHSTFGVNAGAARLSDWMQSALEVPAYHIVLAKPVWDNDYPALKMLEGELGAKSYWIGARLPTELARRPSNAGMVSLRMSEFSYLKILGKEQPNYFADLLAGKTVRPVRGLPRVDVE